MLTNFNLQTKGRGVEGLEANDTVSIVSKHCLIIYKVIAELNLASGGITIKYYTNIAFKRLCRNATDFNVQHV